MFEQDPQPGERIERGNFVTIRVSTGPPKTVVPNVVGQSRDEAVAELVGRRARGRTSSRSNSLEPVDTVLAQAPKAGTEVMEGSTVRINVSKGPKPIAVPNVIGSPFESAESHAPGRSASRSPARTSRSDEPRGHRRRPESRPRARSRGRARWSRSRSRRGPATSQVPDVTSQTEADARAQLQQSGFEVQVVEEIVDDESLDGLVLSQDPEGGTEAEQGTTVVIVVGRFEAPHRDRDDTDP